MREADSLGEPVVRYLPRVLFTRQVHDALAHLYDLSYLQNHALAGLAELGSKAQGSGKALQRVLTEAIESLRPDRSVPAESHAWRGYRILTLRFAEGLQVATVAEKLAISRTECLRDQRVAVEAVISLLWARWGLEEGSPGDALSRLSEQGASARNPSPTTSVARGGFPPPTGRRHNLPAQLTSFVGREREMAEVKRLLGTTRLLTLTGTGGCGKTRLAYQVAAELLDEYRDGVWVVELASLADSMLVPQTVAGVLGVSEQPGHPILEVLVSFLRPRRVLVVLDNCEHILDACAALAGTLLARCRDLRILATSRAVLQIGGEVSWRVPSLAMSDPRQLPPLPILAQHEAVRLFDDRARMVLPGFQVTAQNAQTVAEICWQLDGIPLAIELASARMRVLGVEQIARRLDDRFRLLTGGSRTALPRQQTLRATIDWSYDLLDGLERVLFRRLAVFQGGWTLEAAEAVCGGEGVEEPEVLDLLTRLVDRSLVMVEGAAEGEARYRLLETIRQYADEKLLDSGEADAVRAQHRDWCLDLAERAWEGSWGDREEEWKGRLHGEQDNLRVVFGWCLDRDVEAGLQLAGLLTHFWTWYYHHAEGHTWLSRLLARAPEDLPPLTRARTQFGLGHTCLGLDDYPTGRPLMVESVPVLRALGDRREAAQATSGLASALSGLGDWTEAEALYEAARRLYLEAGLKGRAAREEMNLGWLVAARGDYGRARTLFERLLCGALAAGRSTLVARIQLRLAQLDLAEGKPGEARKRLEGSLRLLEAVGHWYFVTVALICQSYAAIDEGDLAGARVRLAEALTLAQGAGIKDLIVAGIAVAGELAAKAGAFRRSARLLGGLERTGLWSRRRLSAGFWLPVHRYDAAVAAARSALGGDAFDQAAAEGEAMTLEQAVDYALSDDPGWAVPP